VSAEEIVALRAVVSALIEEPEAGSQALPVDDMRAEGQAMQVASGSVPERRW